MKKPPIKTIRLTEIEAQTVLELVNHEIEFLNDHAHAEDYGTDTYQNIAKKLEVLDYGQR